MCAFFWGEKQVKIKKHTALNVWFSFFYTNIGGKQSKQQTYEPSEKGGWRWKSQTAETKRKVEQFITNEMIRGFEKNIELALELKYENKNEGRYQYN